VVGCYNAADMRTLVALDLETTGLDPERDAVIEIGAVRFRGPRVEDQWSTLINPGRPIPPFITELTGIDDQMVERAPRMTEVLGDLAEFVGDHPLVGHNVGFDLAFLRRKGLFEFNEAHDTLDMASVLLPTATRYGLASLAAEFGVPVAASHRALDDAQTSHQVFLHLYELARQLPPPVLGEITRLGAEIEWGAALVFDEAYREITHDGLDLSTTQAAIRYPFLPLDRHEGPLQPADETTPLDPEELASVLEPGGPLARCFPTYEHRPQQVMMLRAVARALSEGRHLMVEAGTGTGKSMAYLVPAFAWASANGRRVLVSTNTINLQEQLLQKDIPDLAKALGFGLRASVLKGRSNYLCPQRLDALRRLGPRTSEEMRVAAKVLVWLSAGGSGDRGQINLLGPAEAAAWARLSAEGDECSSDTCEHFAGGICPYYRARAEAEASHVLIVNHALLLADIVVGNRVLPDYGRLIVDEAHHLEAATTKGLSFEVTEAELTRWLRDLTARPAGLLAQTATAARRDLPPDDSAQVQAAGHEIAQSFQACIEPTAQLFNAVSQFLSGRREGRPPSQYGQQERIIPSTRTLPEWSEVEFAWESLSEPLAVGIPRLQAMADALLAATEGSPTTLSDLAQSLRTATRALAELHGQLNHMIFEPDPQRIYWAEMDARSGRTSLHSAPLDIGPLVERHLWHEKEAVILTSATLTTAGHFDYLRRRLHADDAEELALGSPFDFENATLLYLVNDIAEPSDRQAYQRAVEKGLIGLCRATHGRTLVLFTSNEQLRATARAIDEPLGVHGIQVLEQSEGASRQALLERFRTTEGAVLLGTRSFWEGVDVPGEALSVLAIVRLPFDVPTDPIIAARSETYETPFDEYSLPEAVLRFRQGFGRLIRTQSDRGVVVVFDRRITSKPYGRTFLDSLPTCTSRAGPLADLPAAAARWLGA
jgi:ATP-dependent DNA helicase DinG